ncbi:MAG: HAMP domain-containing protein [Clostridiales bacterium]|nr:HAMP domain-containing protein [Clostridiales bacterium]
MNKLRLNSINKKIGLLVVTIIVVSLLGISVLNYSISKKELVRSNNIILKNAIEFTMVEINRNYDYTENGGWLTEEEAQINSLTSIGMLTSGDLDQVSAATSDGDANVDGSSSATENSFHGRHAIDLGESGYFFIVNSEGDVIYHPFLKDNIYELKSKEGQKVIQDIIKAAKSGGGLLNYSLEDGVSDINGSQTVYSKYFPYWDWVVSAVIYDAELARGSDIILLNNMVGFVLVLAVSIFLVILITGKITNPIKKVVNSLGEVSKGNLTIDKLEVKVDDETRLLADSVNRLIDSLSNVVGMVIGASNDLHTYAQELSSSSEIVSDATIEVANAISQVAYQSDEQHKDTVDSVNKLNHLGDNIRETAEASEKIGLMLQKNIELKDEGLSSVNDLKSANEENNKNTAIIEDLIHKIDEHSNDIGAIITIITNVAKQTNLLALNASIEASRAGEEGRGFAVVAEEIRKLANETAGATDEISDKISQMKAQSEEAVEFVSKNRAGVDRINKTVEGTERVIYNISDGLQALIDDIKIIINHNQEINKKKDEVLVMLGNVTDATQDNSAAIEEISATAQEQSSTVIEITNNIAKLNEMAASLNSLVNEFRV